MVVAAPVTDVPKKPIECGPFVGHVEDTRAMIWARFSEAGNYRLVFGEDSREKVARAEAGQDFCVVWELDRLNPSTKYPYSVQRADGAVLCSGPEYYFRTAQKDDADGEVKIFVGSCAREDAGTAKVWRQADREQIDVCLLIGDTPYIDTSKLRIQRKRYAQFAAVPEMRELLCHTSWYGTWDDHDFGWNDGDGRLEGKDRSRQAFIEYHAHPTYGQNEEGIYTKFRRGPVEVFLLDTRYFSAMEPSPFRKHQASLLGRVQWKWLQDGLAASTAPVKLLTCGMIWNGATRPGKEDHWGSYPHELDALFRFIGEKEIFGVVLVAGDIHRSRVLRHATKDRAGYDIYELISSPMHDGIIESANAPHPGLIRDMGEPNTFLLIEVAQKDQAITDLTARFVNSSGREHFRIDLNP